VDLLQKHSVVEGDSEQATLVKLRHGAAQRLLHWDAVGLL